MRRGSAPVDTTTVLDIHKKGRKVEQRIEEHVKDIERRKQQLSPEEAEEAANRAEAAAAAAPEALRLVDPNAAIDPTATKELIVRSKNTTGQVLWPATEEDIEILSQSKRLYPAPIEVEGSVIIRLVRLSDPVTSPVGRVVHNRQFGIRGNEKWQLLAMGVICSCLIYCLGFWQLYRMQWKKDLIEMRRTRLAMPRVQVKGSPFPWKDKVHDYVYRVVEVRGIFDHRHEMHVGPRPGMDENGNSCPGYNCVTPLRLEDGSTVLINRGHLPAAKVDPATRREVPTWVRVRGVLEEGEVPNMVGNYARLKNRPDRNTFIYLVADELAENSGARNHTECGQALITATDVLYEDNFKAGVRRDLPFLMKHKEDYLLFWADEHTHFNYACQWFGMGTLILAMTVYKFIEVVNWRF